VVALSPDPYPRTRQASSRAELVYITLRQDILNNTYRPGQRLSEEAIAQELNVSRTPVREALKRLHAEGFVEITPHRGAVVRDPSGEELAELCTVREVLEGLAARLAARSISLIEVYSLERLLAEMEAAMAEGRLADLDALNFQFHETIWIASRNRYLAHQLRQLRQFVHRLQESTLTVQGRKGKRTGNTRPCLKPARPVTPTRPRGWPGSMCARPRASASWSGARVGAREIPFSRTFRGQTW